MRPYCKVLPEHILPLVCRLMNGIFVHWGLMFFFLGKSEFYTY